ncbi:MAG: hypothetical protein AB3X44_10250 [Leptothrix sp. (in: b-proteobacteria)]
MIDLGQQFHPIVCAADFNLALQPTSLGLELHGDRFDVLTQAAFGAVDGHSIVLDLVRLGRVDRAGQLEPQAHHTGNVILVIRQQYQCGVVETRDAVKQTPTVVIWRGGTTDQCIVRRVQRQAAEVDLSIRAGQQILDRKLGTESGFGEGEAQRLQHRDARVVQVVIGPDLAAGPLHQRQPLGAQALKTGAALGFGAAPDGGDRISHRTDA